MNDKSHKISIRLDDEKYNFVKDLKNVLSSQLGYPLSYSETVRYLIQRNKNSISNPKDAGPKLARLTEKQADILNELYQKLDAFANDQKLKNYEQAISSNLNQLTHSVNKGDLPSDLYGSLLAFQNTHTGVKSTLTSIRRELSDLQQTLHMIDVIRESEPIQQTDPNNPAQPQGGVDDASGNQYQAN